MSDESSRQYLNRYERLLMQLTRYELRDHAEFLDGSAFRLNSCPYPGDIPLGLYELPRRTARHIYIGLTILLLSASLKRQKNELFRRLKSSLIIASMKAR